MSSKNLFEHKNVHNISHKKCVLNATVVYEVVADNKQLKIFEEQNILSANCERDYIYINRLTDLRINL